MSLIKASLASELGPSSTPLHQGVTLVSLTQYHCQPISASGEKWRQELVISVPSLFYHESDVKKRRVSDCHISVTWTMTLWQQCTTYVLFV